MLVCTCVLSAAGVAPAGAAVLDGTCVANVTLDFSPPATQPLPTSPGPGTTVAGTGTITTCAFPGGGATTGTFGYTLTGNLTCISAQNVAGTLDIAWADGSQSHATVNGLLSVGSVGGTAGLSATITSGRFTGDRVVAANLRNPLALVTCVTAGLAEADGTTILTFTAPLGTARTCRRRSSHGSTARLCASRVRGQLLGRSRVSQT